LGFVGHLYGVYIGVLFGTQKIPRRMKHRIHLVLGFCHVCLVLVMELDGCWSPVCWNIPGDTRWRFLLINGVAFGVDNFGPNASALFVIEYDVSMSSKIHV
jgi:hypothetical protein